ncbi:hypothetical protein ACFL9U_17140 [Thermodesulfobacteriota bacterium]
MAEMTSREQLSKVRDYEKGYFATRLIAIGIELGLFEKIDAAKEGITTIHLAEQLGLHEPYVKIWCQTAYAWELLDCPFLARWYVGDIIRSAQGTFLVLLPKNPKNSIKIPIMIQ